MEQDILKKQRLREFHRRAKLLLNSADRDLLYANLKRYQKEKKLDKLLQCLRAILDTPTKLDLLRDIRAFIPPHQVSEYDREVPYHNMSKPIRASRSLGNLTNPRLFTLAAPATQEAPSVMLHEQPRLVLEPTTFVLNEPRGSAYNENHSSAAFMLSEPQDLHRMGRDDSGDHMRRVAEWRAGHSDTGAGEVRYSSLPRKAIVPVTLVPRATISAQNTPQQHRRPFTGGSPETLAFAVHVPYAEELGLSIRGGSEHGLGIFISDMVPGSPAERSGLHVGDQILEVNSVQFSSLASTSAVTVLTGSERLRVKVRRVGKVPAHKASKEKVAWYDVASRRTVHADPEDQPGVTLPGSLGLRHNERKIYMPSRGGHHLGFNIRGGAEYQLPLYVSRTDRGGLAAEHGLKAGDQLMQVNGSDVTRATHAQCVALIRNNHSLVLTVKDVGMYPAFKDVYTEFKWLDVHTGKISKTRSYKKHTLGGSGSLESIPVLGAEDPPGRLRFAETPADGHVGQEEDDDGLDDVMEHLYEPAPLEDQLRAASLSRLRPTLTRSVTDLRTVVPSGQSLSKSQSRSEYNLATNLTRSKSRSEQNLAQPASAADRACYVYNKNSHAYYSQGANGGVTRSGSAMENALAFTSLHDIHAASTDVSSEWNSDVTMRERASRDASASSTPKGSVKAKSRDKSAPRSSLAVRALEHEARQQHPQLAAQFPQQEKTDVNHNASGSKRKRSIRERLFGSKSKNKEDSKKHGKQRGSLTALGFQQGHSPVDTREFEAHARGVITEDEIQAIVRRIKTYASSGDLSTLIGPLFAILDSRPKMGLCTSIRSLLREGDRSQFDAAVHQRFDEMEVERNLGRTRRLSEGSTYSMQSTTSTTRRKKRQAPPPPTNATPATSTSVSRSTLDKSKSKSMSDIAYSQEQRRTSEFGTAYPRSPVAMLRHIVVVEINDSDDHHGDHLSMSSEDDVIETRERMISQSAASTRASMYQVTPPSQRGGNEVTTITWNDSHDVNDSSSTAVVHDTPQRPANEKHVSDNFSMRVPVIEHNHIVANNMTQMHDLSKPVEDKDTLYLNPAHHNVVVHLSPRPSPIARSRTPSPLSSHSPSPRRTPSPTSHSSVYSSSAPSQKQQSPVVLNNDSPTDLLKHSPLDHAFRFLSAPRNNKSRSPSPPSPRAKSRVSPSPMRQQEHSHYSVPSSPQLQVSKQVEIIETTRKTTSKSSPKPLAHVERKSHNVVTPQMISNSDSKSISIKDNQTKNEESDHAVIFIPKSPTFIYKPPSKTIQTHEVESKPNPVSRSNGRVSRKASKSSFNGEKPLLNSTMDDLDQSGANHFDMAQSVIKVNHSNQKSPEIKPEKPQIFLIDKSAKHEIRSQNRSADIPVPPPPPPITPATNHVRPSPSPSPIKSNKSLAPPIPADAEGVSLASILTKSLESQRKELKPINKSNNHQVFHSAGAVKNGGSTDQNVGSDTSSDDQSKKGSKRSSGNFLIEASKTLERYKQSHTPSTSRRASTEDARKSDDTISVTSTMTVSRAKPELPVCDYMESDSMFPVFEASSSIRQNTTFTGDFKTPPAKRRDLTESVLQATSTLDFLDTMETDSNQWDSSVVATHGETSGVLTPRSDTSEAPSSIVPNPAYQSTIKKDNQSDMNTSGVSIGSSHKRAPPTFIAPPPPSEPPPSDDESMTGSECSCTPQSDVSSERHHSDGSHGDGPVIAINRNGAKRNGMHVDSDADSLFGFLSDSKYKDDAVDSAYNDTTADNTTSEPVTNNNKEDTPAIEQNETERPRSWLFRKSPTRSPPAPSEDVTSFFERPDSPKLAAASKDGSDRMLVYLDKSHRTLGLSISGGTDSKAQPEIRVKAVFPGGAAEAEGTMKAGMQLLSIDGTCLEAVTHMRAVVTIKRAFDDKANKHMAVELKG